MDYTDIQSVLNKTFQEPLTDLVNNANPVLKALRKKFVASPEIYLKAKIGGDHGAGPVVDGAAVTFSGDEGTDFINPAVQWSTYIGKFSVHERALAQAAGNPGELGNLFKYEIEQAAIAMANSIAADLFGDVTVNGLVGLQAWVNNDNTVAGINRALAANDNYRSAVVDFSDGDPTTPEGTELSTLKLYQADQEFFKKNGYGFAERAGDFTGITSAEIFTKYQQLLESIDLSSLATAHFVNQANSSGNLGIKTVGWQGIPLMRDRNISAGATDLDDTSRIYFADMSKIFLCTLNPDSSLAMLHQNEGMMSAPDVDGINTSVHIMGRTGERVQGYVRTYIQLATPDPKGAGILLKNIRAI